jgi:hypothetical protein
LLPCPTSFDDSGLRIGDGVSSLPNGFVDMLIVSLLAHLQWVQVPSNTQCDSFRI